MKFTTEQEHRVVQAYLSGESGRALGRRYGADASTIYDMVRRHGQRVRKAGAPTQYSIDEEFFDKIDSHVKAQILGFIYADGNLSILSEQSGALDVSLNRKDENYLEWIRCKTKSTRPLLRYEYSSFGDRHLATRFVTNNPKIVDAVQRLGITPRKSLTATFPSLGQVPDEFLGSFILGVFEGDGCMNLRKPTAKCATRHGSASIFGSEPFIVRLQEVLAQRGIKATTYPKMTKAGVKCLNLYVNTVEDVMRFYDFIYAHATYRMERKHAKFVEYKSQYRRVERPDGSIVHELIHRNYTEQTRQKMSHFGRAKAARQFGRDMYLRDAAGVIYHFDLAAVFGRQIGVRRQEIYRLIKGDRQEFKGWTRPTDLEIESARAAGTLITRLYRQPEAAPAPTLAIAA